MGKKPRSESCSSGWCQNHVMQLQPLKNADCYYRKKIKLRLCPKHSNQTNTFSKSIPMINKDGKHYTPCFILEQQQTYYASNDEKLKSTHRHKLQSEGSGTIMIPKHGRKRNYCSVCRIDYQDYLNHVEDQLHRQNLRSNKFSKFILETQEKINLSINTKAIEQFIEIKVLDQTNQPEKTGKNKIVTVIQD